MLEMLFMVTHAQTSMVFYTATLKAFSLSEIFNCVIGQFPMCMHNKESQSRPEFNS